MVDETSLARHLLVVMLFGAARSDATPEQVARIRDECLPMMRDHETGLDEVVRHLFSIMGDWMPAGEWEDWIVNLLPEPLRAAWPTRT